MGAQDFMTPPNHISNPAKISIKDPTIQNEACPEEIRAKPLPYDICSPENPDWRTAGSRYSKLSLHLDNLWRILGPGENNYFTGLGTIFRPNRKLGIGGQMDWNYANQIDAYLRLQGSYNLQRHGLYRLTLAALVGMTHLYGQRRIPVGEKKVDIVSGNLFSSGVELALDIRLHPLFTLSPFSELRYSPQSTLSSGTSNREVHLSSSLNTMIGLRLGFNFFQIGQ